MKYAAALIVLLALPLAAQAPATILVGNPTVDGSRLATGRWQVQFARVVDGKDQASAPYYWDVVRLREGGRDLLLSLQSSASANGGRDSSFVDAHTLQPVRFHSVNPPDTMLVTYDGLNYSLRHVGKNGVEEAKGRLEAAMFDGSASDLVVGSLPLALGYRARIPQVLPSSLLSDAGKAEWMTVEVTGEGDSNGRAVWKVDVTTPRFLRHELVDRRDGTVFDARMTVPPMGRYPGGELHMTKTAVKE